MSLQDSDAFYYMRDNHTFRRLDRDVTMALAQIEEELDAGWTSGMLCSSNPDTTIIHSDYKRDRAYFLTQCHELLRAKGTSHDL